ncbi:hypothetical protein [Tsukamurella soli]|uniref:Uncharacterized protein n=1 Tax=Tsukamurella soli TaxID=644556 RepID=A0ABP8KCI4_9ACTN
MAPTVPDPTAFAQRVDAAADTAHSTLIYVSTSARGKRVSTACDHLSVTEKAVRQVADDGARALTAAQILAKAVTTWQHAHPSDEILAAAQQAVEDAHRWAVICEEALDGRQTGGDLAAAQDNLRIADDELAVARAHLTDVKHRRELADKALESACGPAMTQLHAIKGAGAGIPGRTSATGDSGWNAPGAPATPTTPKPVAGSGTPAGTGSTSSTSTPSTHTSTATPAVAKPASSTTSPVAATKPTTPGAATPTTGSSSTGTGTSTDPATLLAAASLLSGKSGGQQTATPTAQQTSTPASTAATPTAAASTPQQSTDADRKKKQAEQVGDAALSAAGIGTSAAVMPTMPQVPQTAASTPAVAQQVSAPEPATPPAALTTGPVVNPRVSGTSVTGLTTAEDIGGGRATPTAFTDNVGPATTVSGTTGGTQSAPASGAGTHPAQTPGLPMNPGAIGASMPGGGARSAGKAEEKKIFRYVDPQLAELTGETTLAESVRHYGTIGVNTDHAA